MKNRHGEVWVGKLADQGAYLVLYADDTTDDLGECCERWKVFDLLHGKLTQLITRGIDEDANWVMYS